VDGGPAASFRLRDLREATALLSQDHSLFGSVSIAEDIGMGRWSHVAQGDRVAQALRLGGAHHFVTKLRAGTDTVLHPISTKGCSSQELREPIQHLYDRLEKSSSVSGEHSHYELSNW
jgi:ABC-type multidrug transport system fused ATPase/permease subunit